MKHQALSHRFVDDMPEELEPGLLYVSMQYATAIHLCACGCGREIVTPFSPAQWKLIFDGETISLMPSIGSWGLPCRSHYLITKGKIIEALPWSDDNVRAGQQNDRRKREEHYAHVGSPPAPTAATERNRGWFERLKAFVTLRV
jgi:hypothetical protein